jgi:hypothetical protein
LADKADLFAPEEYGLLYHYLQTKNDGILNSIQSLSDYEESSLTPLKNFLEDKMSEILRDNFSEADLSYLQTIKQSSNVAPIFEVFIRSRRTSGMNATSTTSYQPSRKNSGKEGYK